jgi:hypothetical protein
MSDSGDFDFLGEDFEWKDEPAAGAGASGEPPPSQQQRSFKSDLARLRDEATASPGRIALLALAALAAAAIVVGLVLATRGNDESNNAAQTTTPATTSAQTQTQTQPAAPPAAPAIVVATAATIRPGDNGATVRTLQRALRQLGFAPGAVDGKFGQKTTDAVIAFQRAHQLTPDGLVGAKTAKAINQALAQAQ